MSEVKPGVTYPRDVPIEPGMPAGWKGIEKAYGPTSKSAGRTYVRYFSLDGKYKNLLGPKNVIEAHCKDTGEDFQAMYNEYLRLQQERQELRREESRKEREARGKLQAGDREAAIAKFEERFGKLTGPVVFSFPGWVTRWHFQPNCAQVMVEYVDTEGTSWKLLRDLECAFQVRIDNGTGADIPAMIEEARARADPEEFSKGSRSARELGGVYECSAQGTRTFTQEDRAAMRAQQMAEIQERRKKRRVDVNILTVQPEAHKQVGWAVPSTKPEALEAFDKFQQLLLERGFGDNVPMLAIMGVSEERKYRSRLLGVYYQLPATDDAGKECFQRLLHFPDKPRKLACDGMYIVHSTTRLRWELATRLHEYRPVLGFATTLEGTWQLQEGQADYREESGLVILKREVKAS